MEIDVVRMVFTQKGGAAASLDDVKDLFKEFEEVDFKVEVFLAAGSKTFSDYDELAGAL